MSSPGPLRPLEELEPLPVLEFRPESSEVSTES
jgi:hypothetical protein